LLSLQKRTEPRWVNGQVFLAALEGKPRAEVEIMYLKDDPDVLQVAMQLSHVLQEAKWTVKFLAPLPPGNGDEPAASAFGGAPDGITVVEHWSPENFKAFATGHPNKCAPCAALEDAIERAVGVGVTVRTGPRNNPPEGTLRIVVAPKR
jgi:hypothetical protein